MQNHLRETAEEGATIREDAATTAHASSKMISSVAFTYATRKATKK